jgi:MFS family permease
VELRPAPPTAVTLQEPLLRSDPVRQPLLSWQLVFYMNVFFACTSFSIVMPTLWLYLHRLQATKPFYALVVASYSIGEAIGSFGLGHLSVLFGVKNALRLCCLIAMSGAVSYALAGGAWEIRTPSPVV